MGSDNPADDWTAIPNGPSNSSPEFLAIADVVERLLRTSARLGDNPHNLARLIVAQLAHKHDFGPRAVAERQVAAAKAAALNEAASAFNYAEWTLVNSKMVRKWLRDRALGASPTNEEPTSEGFGKTSEQLGPVGAPVATNEPPEQP